MIITFLFQQKIHFPPDVHYYIIVESSTFSMQLKQVQLSIFSSIELRLIDVACAMLLVAAGREDEGCDQILQMSQDATLGMRRSLLGC